MLLSSEFWMQFWKSLNLSWLMINVVIIIMMTILHDISFVTFFPRQILFSFYFIFMLYEWLNAGFFFYFILFEYRVLICLISLLSSVLISYMNDWMNIHGKILATLLRFLIGFPVKGANNIKKKPTTKRLFSKCA